LSQIESLTSLERLLESFLDRAVELKEERLEVLEGINRLDDIARGFLAGDDLTEDVGGWFAEHNTWLKETVLKDADRNRIALILGEIKREIRVTEDSSPAINKISKEISRWSHTSTGSGSTIDGQTPALSKLDSKPPRLVLKRGAENVVPPLSMDMPRRSIKQTPEPVSNDTIAMFGTVLERTSNLFSDIKRDREHLLSVLDDSLKSAILQQNKDALLLSGFIIYYLKQNGYMVEPYVKRLKEAENMLNSATGSTDSAKRRS